MNLGRLLERQAAHHGPSPFVTQAETAETLSYDEFNRRVNAIAHGLAELRAGGGRYVAIMLSNCIDFLASSYALKKINCVEVSINSSFRGIALTRMINLTGCDTLITSSDYVDAVAEVFQDLPRLRRLILVDDTRKAKRQVPDLEIVHLDEVISADESDLDPNVADDTTAVILFTSGTTGVSKGCAIPHRSSIRAAESMIEAFSLTADDCVYSPYPLFHVGASQYDVLPALMIGGRAVVRESFSVSAFWPEVARYGVTWFMLLGSVQRLLWSAPQSPDESQHAVRFVWGTPLPIDHDAFEQRFRLRVARGGGYGSTEAGSVALPMFDKDGAGRVLDRYDVRIVDHRGNPLPAGKVGELIIRQKEPAIMATEYVGMPEETARSWCNGWFHTGDLAHLDADGDLHFVARMAERLRVKGEMVSAFEIEEVICGNTSVEDCAVIGVPDGDGEESIAAFVTLRAGREITVEALIAYCRPLMSKYMLPTTLQIIDEMPRTPSGKPAIAELRKQFL